MSNDVQDFEGWSIAAKLVRAVALAAILVPLGSIPSEAESFHFDESNTSHIFSFDDPFADYSFELEFAEVRGGFDLDVTNTLVSPAAMAARAAAFPGYVCVPFANGGDSCVDFEVTAPPPGDPDDPDATDTWFGSYDVTVRWLLDTNGGFPDDGGRIRILHNRGDQPGINFDTDITVPGSYDDGCGDGPCVPPPCEVCIGSLAGDPAIGGRDDNFQSLAVFQAPQAVPEPATLVLLTTGVSGLFYRRRRRQQEAARLLDPRKTT
jgi:hypothetical protein